MATIGKQFEQAIKENTPDEYLYYRLKDPAGAFGNNSSLRFSQKNPFDAMIFDPVCGLLYALELKTVSGKSISFERTKEEHGEIHVHQICGLQQWGKYDRVISGFIIEFRGLEKTIFLDIDTFTELSTSIDKKSFNLKDLDSRGLRYTIIDQHKLRTRYRYDMEKFLLASRDNYKEKEILYE